MNSNLTRTLSRGLALTALFVCGLSADTVKYSVNNLTASGGDPVYSIATDVTFNSLTLREAFADGTTAAVALYDASNVAQTSLSTSTFDLQSLSLNTIDASHGALLSATLTGIFSQTSLSIVTAFGGTPTTVTVSPNFTATLSLASNSVAINAIAGATSYAAGTLESTITASPAVPEPATYAIASLGLVSLLALGRRVRR